MNLKNLFKTIITKFGLEGLSDIIISTEGLFVLFKQDLTKIDIMDYNYEELLKELLEKMYIYDRYKNQSEESINEILRLESSFNAAFTLEEEVLRVRGHIFLSRNKPICILRLIRYAEKDFRKLGFSLGHINPFLERTNGLILISGPTGSGKSTTASALIEHYNKNFKWHIITIEEPIEYLFEDINSKISQREIGIDTPSYAEALKDVLKERPNVVFVGEIISKEVAELVLQAATAGQIVLATIHASSVIETLDRFIGLYEIEHEYHVRLKLAYSLIGIISQKLVKIKDNGDIKMKLLYEPFINIHQSKQIMLSPNQKLTLLYDILKRQKVKLITEQLDELIEQDLLIQ